MAARPVRTCLCRSAKDLSRTGSEGCPFRTGQGGLPPRLRQDQASLPAKAAFPEKHPAPPLARLYPPSSPALQPLDRAYAYSTRACSPSSLLYELPHRHLVDRRTLLQHVARGIDMRAIVYQDGQYRNHRPTVDCDIAVQRHALGPQLLFLRVGDSSNYIDL